MAIHYIRAFALIQEVEGRLLPKSHGFGKTFPGPQALKTLSSVQKWLNELCEELSERLQSDLEQNKRITHTLTLHLNDSESLKKFPSKSCPLSNADDVFGSAIKFDKVPRGGPKAFVSEYTVTVDDAGKGSLLATLSEAGFLVGLERNCCKCTY